MKRKVDMQFLEEYYGSGVELEEKEDGIALCDAETGLMIVLPTEMDLMLNGEIFDLTEPCADTYGDIARFLDKQLPMVKGAEVKYLIGHYEETSRDMNRFYLGGEISDILVEVVYDARVADVPTVYETTVLYEWWQRSDAVRYFCERIDKYRTKVRWYLVWSLESNHILKRLATERQQFLERAIAKADETLRKFEQDKWRYQAMFKQVQSRVCSLTREMILGDDDVVIKVIISSGYKHVYKYRYDEIGWTSFREDFEFLDL